MCIQCKILNLWEIKCYLLHLNSILIIKYHILRIYKVVLKQKLNVNEKSIQNYAL